MRGLSRTLILLILVVPLAIACRSAKSATSEHSIHISRELFERHKSHILAKDSVFVEHFRDSTKMDSIIRVNKSEIIHHYHTIFVHDSSAVVHDTAYIEKAATEIVRKPTFLEIWREAIPLSLTLSIILTLLMILVLLRKR